MASLVILSSSPPQPQHYREAYSSSPGFLSPSTLLRTQRFTVDEGSRSPGFSDHESKGFMSTAKLLQVRRFEYRPDTPKSVHEQPVTRWEHEVQTGGFEGPKKPKGNVGKPKNPQKAAGGKMEKVGEIKKGAKSSKSSKSQAMIGITKITKPRMGSAVPKRKSSDSLKLNRAISRHLETKMGDLHGENFDTNEGLMLERAMTRRVAWTPPIDTVATVDLSATTPTALEANKSSDGDLEEESSFVFGDLLFNFEYGNHQTAAPKTTSQSKAIPIIPRKRKSAEPSIPPKQKQTRKASPVKKPKAPKKKPVTITGQATALYATENPSNPESVSLLEHLEEQRETRPSSEITPAADVAAPNSVAPRRGPRKAKTKKSTKEKTGLNPLEKVLLSPDSALKKFDTIDLVFGTSSQLVRKSSPTVIRDLRTAITESEPSQTFDSQSERTEILGSTGNIQRIAPMFRSSKSLWSAATRDNNGSLTSVKIVDLVDSPPVPKIMLTSSSLKTAGKANKPEAPKTTIVDESALLEKSEEIGAGSTCPNFGGYTTVQLAKEIAKFGFKPIRSRRAQIELLERCWEGQQRTTLSSLGDRSNSKATGFYSTTSLAADSTQKPAETSHKSSAEKTSNKASKGMKPSAKLDEAPRRPRGRPKKETSNQVASPKKKAVTTKTTPTKPKRKAFLIEEISDSDAPMTPSPPRQKSSQSLELSHSTTTAPSPKLDTPAKKDYCFECITKAVTTYPPTHDIKNPTWQEKILMYDPIVLEDLAAWLNTEGLARVGFDGEVHAAEVREWCESRSICCIWKVNLRGGTRSRW